jgi:hypothetical protein
VKSPKISGLLILQAGKTYKVSGPLILHKGKSAKISCPLILKKNVPSSGTHPDMGKLLAKLLQKEDKI